MKRAVSYPLIAGMLFVGLPFAADPAAAQSRLSFELGAGPSSYDLAGTGTGGAGAMALAWRPRLGLVVEPGVTLFGYQSQFGSNTKILFPEVSVQGELPSGSFHPFLGGGVGAALGVSGAGSSGLTLHAVGGLRVDLSQNWGLSGQMRVRAVRPWSGNTVDFLFGASRRFQSGTAMIPTGPENDPVRPVVLPTRLELAAHLGVHVDRHNEVDRAILNGSSAMFATAGEASAFGARLGYWLRPRVGLQLDVSRSSNASWQGGTSLPPPSFANRTTYLSARAVARTAPQRGLQLSAAAGPAVMLYSGSGENLRTRDADFGGVLEVGARLRVTQWLGAELALSNYFYGSRYREGGSVFRHDFLILPGLVFSWQ